MRPCTTECATSTPELQTSTTPEAATAAADVDADERGGPLHDGGSGRMAPLCDTPDKCPDNCQDFTYCQVSLLQSGPRVAFTKAKSDLRLLLHLLMAVGYVKYMM